MFYYRQVPNLSQTNLNEIYASQTASIERGGHPDMEFLQPGKLLLRFEPGNAEGQLLGQLSLGGMQWSHFGVTSLAHSSKALTAAQGHLICSQRAPDEKARRSCQKPFTPCIGCCPGASGSPGLYSQ